MERVLNPDERIRRAEELYARRKAKIDTRASATVSVDKRNNRKYTRKLIIQFIICALIYCAFYAIKNIPNLVSQEVMYKISDVLEYDINVQDLYNTYIKKDEETQSTENNNLIEETLSATDTVTDEETVEDNESMENIETTQEEAPEETVKLAEECSSLSLMGEDAEYIKANYSFIKPLTGEITSRYGVRNPTAANVSKYHTGIDIARVTGTVIVAAMEGTVELVSSQGSYGNHLKITNGDVTTLYAHCNKIYVKEGEKIKQGQEIAEVGATGNVTGPHLHFEIRRNNQYVDPGLILDF